MNYIVADHRSIDRHDWTEYVLTQPTATVFHTPYAYDFLSATSSHEPFALFVRDSEKIVALMTGSVQTVGSSLISGFTRRALLMQTPIYNDVESLDALLKLYIKYTGRKVVYTEIRNHLSEIMGLRVFNVNGFIWEDHLDIFMDLSQNPDEMLKRMESSRRKQINRGLKRGLRVFAVPQDDIETIQACHRIICGLYRKIALPAPEWIMIEQAFIQSCDLFGAQCFAAEYEGRIVGTRMILYAKHSIFDWFAASLEEFYHLYPNDVLPWEVFLWGHERGFTRFDFGGAGKPNVPYGVRDYKLKFGGELVNTGRMIRIHRPFNYAFATKAYRLLQVVKKSK